MLDTPAAVPGREQYRQAQAKITAERAAIARQLVEAPKAPRRHASELYARRKAKEERFSQRVMIATLVLCALSACVLAASAWFAYSTACVA